MANNAMIEDLDGLPELARNLRWFVCQQEKDPTKWAEWIEQRSRRSIKRTRAYGLLCGAPAGEDLERLCDLTGWEPEALQTARFYQGDESVWRENLNFLLDAIPRGANEKAARAIGVRKEQLSRWRNRKQNPSPANLAALLKFHGIDPDLDLERVPLYLSMEPISGYAQKKWLASRVQEIPAEELTKHFPSLWRILKDDEVD